MAENDLSNGSILVEGTMNESKCVNPEEIQQGDLIAYLHGDTSSQVVEHITRCRFCSQQVEQLRMVDAQLLAVFYREDCPAPETLADFALNRLSAVEKLRVATHVRGCTACSEEAASLRDLLDEEPPSLLAQLREALAIALNARPVQRAAVPLRGTSDWQGRFEVGDLIITLSSQAGSLTGRVRKRGAPPGSSLQGQAWLLKPQMTKGASIPQSPVDEGGRLQFTALAKGSYVLLIQIGDQNVRVETVQVR